MPIDLSGLVRGVKDRVVLFASADKSVAEALDILRDMHRIFLRLEQTMDRLDAVVAGASGSFASLAVSTDRIARLEEAIFNIERATGGVEGAINALPRAVRERIFPPGRRTESSDLS